MQIKPRHCDGGAQDTGGTVAVGMLMALLVLLIATTPAAAQEAAAPEEGSAASYPGRAIDRPTSLPAWMPAASVTLGGTRTGDEYAMGARLEGYIGLPAHFEAGLVLPEVQLAPSRQVVGPTASLAYGWDVSDTVALLPSVAHHVGITQGDAAASEVAVEATWTVSSAFEVGLLPSVQQTYGDGSSTTAGASLLAFTQLTPQFSILFAGGPSLSVSQPDAVAASVEATFAYTIASQDAVVADLFVYAGLPQAANTAHADPFAQWSDWQASVGLFLFLPSGN